MQQLLDYSLIFFAQMLTYFRQNHGIIVIAAVILLLFHTCAVIRGSGAKVSTSVHPLTILSQHLILSTKQLPLRNIPTQGGFVFPARFPLNSREPSSNPWAAHTSQEGQDDRSDFVWNEEINCHVITGPCADWVPWLILSPSDQPRTTREPDFQPVCGF